MKKLTPQVQMYIAIGVIAVLAVAFIALAIVPKSQESAAVKSEIAVAETDLQTAQALLARRQSVKAQAASNEVALMTIANQIPDSPQLPSLIIELQEIANSSGVTLGQIGPGAIAAAAPAADGTVPAYSTVPITVTLTGEWGDVIDCLRRLHAMHRGVRVTNSTVSAAPSTGTEAGEVGNVLVNVAMETYVMEGATAAPVGSAAPPATP